MSKKELLSNDVERMLSAKNVTRKLARHHYIGAEALPKPELLSLVTKGICGGDT